MGRSVLSLALWGTLAFGAVIAAGALFGARPSAAGTELDVVRWPAGQTSVAVCTRQGGRPGWVTAERFFEMVSQAADGWSELDTGLRIDYLGRCDTQSASSASGVVEVSWDLGTFLDRPGVDSVTMLETRRSNDEDVGQILAAQVVLRPWLIGPTASPTTQIAALRGLLGHEFGHLLGLSHTDSQLDLMYGGPVTARDLSMADARALARVYRP